MSTLAAVKPARELNGPWKLDTGVVAVMLAGASTFLNVYSTQPLLPFLRRVYGASEAQVSLTVGATMLGVAVAAPIFGLLAEALGRKRIIIPAIFALSVPTLMAATAPTLHALIFWRLAQGLCVPGIIAVMLAYINEEWAGRGLGTTMAAYVAGTVLGGFLGRFIPGVVSAHFPWRWSFVVLALLNFGCGLIVWRYLPKSENHVRATDLRSAVSEGLAHFRNLHLLANFVMGFTLLFWLVGTFTYVNFHLAAPPFHLSSAALGSIFFVYLFGMFVTPFAGRYLDAHGFLKTIALALLISVSGLLLTLSHSLWLVIVGLALTATGAFISQSAATVETSAIAGRAKSSAAGLYVTFYYVGGGAGAVLPAWFWAYGGWPACVALQIAAALTTLLLAFVSTMGERPVFSSACLPAEE